MTVSVPMSMSRCVVYSETPTLGVGVPVWVSTTLTINTLGPGVFGLTVSVIVNLLLDVLTVVWKAVAVLVVGCCCAAAIGEGSMAVALVHQRLAEIGGE